MPHDDEETRRPGGHGLDGPPRRHEGQDVSGEEYVNDPSYRPPEHGEGLASAPEPDAAADTSGEQYVRAETDEEAEERRDDERDEPDDRDG